MAAKKTAKQPTESAPAKAPAPVAKKAAKTAAKKAAPAKTTTKAAKSTTEKAASPVAKIVTSEMIARAAYLLYRRRVEQGLPGDSQGDWIEAERQLATSGGN